MTIRAFHRLKICIVTLGMVVASEAHADCADCVNLTLNANLNVTKLHTGVIALRLQCGLPGATVVSGNLPVANRAYVGPATVTLSVPASYIASRADHSVTVTCSLLVVPNPTLNANGPRSAMLIEGNPQPIACCNWTDVGPGSTIEWQQVVTFPNAAAP